MIGEELPKMRRSTRVVFALLVVVSMTACGGVEPPAPLATAPAYDPPTDDRVTIRESTVEWETYRYELTQEILQNLLTDFILVTEEEMKEAVRIYLETVRNLAEEAGAASLAAARKIKHRLQGKTMALVLSGGNISISRLRRILSAED